VSAAPAAPDELLAEIDAHLRVLAPHIRIRHSSKLLERCQIALAANAALAARCVPREPTVAMLRVDIPHYACGGMMSGCQLGEVWRTMYDAALASQAEGGEC
jgi:hypothetical protein